MRGIFAASFGVVLLEIALGRIFSFTIWYHFSYLTISVALLGFAAAGSLLAAFPRLLDDVSALLRQASLTAALGVAILLFVASGVSLDPVAVLHEKQQLTNLAGYYLALMMPFLGAGMAIVGAIAVAPTRIARLYFWDLAGAALACLAVVPLIWRFGTPVTVALSATAFCAAAVAFSRPTTPSRVALAIVLATVTIAVGATVEFVPGSKKFLSIHSATGARPIFQRWTPINRVDVVAWDETTQDDRLGYRGWGASPRYDGPGQHFRMIGYDGDSCASMYRWSGAREELDWLHHHVFEAPYLLTERPRVLVIGVGGGVDILTAIANDAASIVGVELNPITIALEQGPYAAYNGGILNRPEVTMVAAGGRHFLRSTADRYDLIEMNSIGTLSASSSAAYVLPESYLHRGRGQRLPLASHARWGLRERDGRLQHPGMAAASYPPAALERCGAPSRAAASRRRNVTSRSWPAPRGLAMVHTLVKAEPFTAEDMARLDAFVQTEGFEYWQRPDRRASITPRRSYCGAMMRSARHSTRGRI